MCVAWSGHSGEKTGAWRRRARARRWPRGGVIEGAWRRRGRPSRRGGHGPARHGQGVPVREDAERVLGEEEAGLFGGAAGGEAASDLGGRDGPCVGVVVGGDEVDENRKSVG